MKFGLFYEMQGASDRSDQALYGEHLKQFELADQLGYDCLWLAELHFNRGYSVMPNPNLALAAASQVTSRIGLGTGISVLPINHPLRLAEEIATLDLLSGGRVQWGIGRGHPMTGIYDHFGVDIETSKACFRESLDIILKAWSEERFSFDGQFYQIDDAAVVPKPLQSGGPSVYVSAFSPDTFALAAEYGTHLFLPAQVTPKAMIKQAVEGFHAQLQAKGRNPAEHRTPVLLPVYIDEDGDRARRDIERAMMSYYEIIESMMGDMMARLQRKHAEFPESYKGYLQLGEIVDGLTYEAVCSEFAIFGSPEEAVDRLSAYQEETGVDDFILWTNVGAMPHDKVSNSMKLFAEKVMPQLA